MNSKKKMIIAISAFAMVVLAAIVAVFAVLSAQQASVKSYINVTYTAVNVKGTMTAQYKVAGETNATNIGTGTIEFLGNESDTNAQKELNSSGSLNISNLTSTNNYIEFIFTFTNTGSSAYTAEVTLPTTIVNFTVDHTTVPNSGGATKTNNTKFTLAANTTTPVTYVVKYTITNPSSNATLSGSFDWNLQIAG